MREKIICQFEKLEALKNQVVSHIEKYSPEALSKKPAADKWNVLQVLFHVIETENASVKYMRKKISYNKFKKSSTNKNSLKLWALKMAFKLPFKFTAPKFTTNIDDELSKEELIELWNDIRKSLKETLYNLTEEQLNAELFKHIILGKININQGLDFVHTHLERHYKQIVNTLKQVKK